MLSDESSSDSETGRFKSRKTEKNESKSSSNKRDDHVRLKGRDRATENDRFRREFDKRRDEHERYPRERPRFLRHSPVRRRNSRDRSTSRKRSPDKSVSRRRSRERDRHRNQEQSIMKSRSRGGERSISRERRRRSRSKSRKSEQRDPKEENKNRQKDKLNRTLSPKKDIGSNKHNQKSKDETNNSSTSKREKSAEKCNRTSKDSSLSPPEFKGKKSEVYKPAVSQKKKSQSPIVVEEVDSDVSAEVQPGSYYNMIPAIVKDKSEDSSEIDSSDDERLRAKLLNLEKELQRTRKKKLKKKHKKKSKSSKERDRESSAVEVTSTTDIDKVVDLAISQGDNTEVTSSQKNTAKECSEEGEITSGDDSKEQIIIDPTDLRHKLSRPPKSDTSKDGKSSADICGPALPPHLSKSRSASQEVEGPALPPHLQKPRNIGPSIPDDVRKVLADREVIKYESSDEDPGIGPLPVGSEEKWSAAHQHLEERALDMKIRQLDGHSMQNADVKSREKWMLELPEGKAKYLGLEARSFRAKEGPDMSDRSSWTDTPEEKARKAAGVVKEEDADVILKREAKARQISNRDEEQERAIKKHKKKHKRDESLLEIHEKKLKKKKKKDSKDEEQKERRPFSRDVDLQVNRFDEAQKKSIIKKAQALDSRFSRGEAKFL